MTQTTLNILVMEAYDNGSHGSFLNGLIKFSKHSYVRLSLPARKWKWRMRGSAIYFARELKNIWPEDAVFQPEDTDVIFTSDMTSVTDLKALLPTSLKEVPIVCYFHENQLTYPLSEHDEIDYQYGFTNITSALAADGLWFNSEYNRQSFIQAADELLKKMPDYVPQGIPEDIACKSIIMAPGIYPDYFAPTQSQDKNSNCPVILWNHRWEYDKNPELFFNTLYKIADKGIDFRLIVAGESFRSYPNVFDQAKEKLHDKIIHFGYAESRAEYIRLLHLSDVVISTAIHEFFGLAIVEAIACGCIPLLPNRLNYPYLIPGEYHEKMLFTSEKELEDRLGNLIIDNIKPCNASLYNSVKQYNWESLSSCYDAKLIEMAVKM